MNDLAGGFPGTFVSANHGLAREFEERLRDSGTLALRVAYSVLRHREDAEDVAQESLAKAYRSFAQLRDRERFRAWLVRTTWRMALDRRRGDRRRVGREQVAVWRRRLARRMRTRVRIARTRHPRRPDRLPRPVERASASIRWERDPSRAPIILVCQWTRGRCWRKSRGPSGSRASKQC